MTILMRTRYSKMLGWHHETRFSRPTPPRHFDLLKLLPPAPRMVGPQVFYPLVKPTIVPKSAPQVVTAPKSRMDKFTSVEKRLLDEINDVLGISKRSGEYGYCLKLVKRGYFKEVPTTKKHWATFAITHEGERARAGMMLLKLYRERTAGLTAFASGNTMRQGA